MIRINATACSLNYFDAHSCQGILFLWECKQLLCCFACEHGVLGKMEHAVACLCALVRMRALEVQQHFLWKKALKHEAIEGKTPAEWLETQFHWFSAAESSNFHKLQQDAGHQFCFACARGAPRVQFENTTTVHARKHVHNISCGLSCA